jgi:hypothetical protein
VKLSLLPFCMMVLLAGCQTMPDTADTTNARLRFRVHYQAPGLTTPHVEITTTTSTEARRCIYVNAPFGVVANVADKGGVQWIIIGPSQLFDAVSARTADGDIVAIPSPAEPTQTTSGGVSYPNPGNRPDSAVVQVGYSTVKAFDAVTLMSVYDFKGGATRAAMRATARNFGATTGVSEVYHFFVERATSDPARQPGMSCAVP